MLQQTGPTGIRLSAQHLVLHDKRHEPGRPASPQLNTGVR